MWPFQGLLEDFDQELFMEKNPVSFRDERKESIFQPVTQPELKA